MHFSEFTQFLDKIEKISSRNEMTVALAEFIKKLQKEEIKETMYLLTGRLVPTFISLEFNFSEKLAIKALEEIKIVYPSRHLPSANPQDDNMDVQKLFNNLGDVGLVAEKVIEAQKGKDAKPTILEVYNKLSELAKASGKGSVDSKKNIYKEIVLMLDPLSSKYLTRMIIGSLRLGLSQKTILDSLSWAIAGDKSLRINIDNAYGARADIGYIAEILSSKFQVPSSKLEKQETSNQENQNEALVETKNKVVELLTEIEVTVGTPVASKLVEREASSQAVWKRMPECYVQPKLDGLRGQLHYKKRKMKNEKRKEEVPFPLSERGIRGEENNSEAYVFSRNMENMTDQYPDLLLALENLGVESIVLDSEIIGFTEETQKYKSYQETMQRRRKFDIDLFAKDIPVRSMCFDVLYFNGQDLTKHPIEERLQILEKVLSDTSKQNTLKMLETKQMKSEEELEEYFKTQVESGLEGIITKEKNSIYEPGTRNFKWIKLKANTRSDLVDTIDVVVMGYYSGGGDRARFGFGALLAGVYDPKEDKYYSLGKVGSGFTEEEMKQMFEDMSIHKTLEMPTNYVVEKSLYPNVWLLPKIVMEIDADEITRSPNHTAARGIDAKVPKDDPTKGLSIRFPRMKKWMRDKEYPNSVEEIVRMYELRKGSKV